MKVLYHIIKPEIDFLPEQTNTMKVYEKAAENFQMFQDKGLVGARRKRKIIMYAQTMNGKTNMGWW